jgi:hypothetical protein
MAGEGMLSTFSWLTPRRATYAVICLTLLMAGTREFSAHGLTRIPIPGLYRIPADQIAVAVGTHYGDRHPQVVYVMQDQTDNSQEPMYTVRMTGNFRDGGTSFHCIIFGALANRMDVFYSDAYLEAATCHRQNSNAESFALDWDASGN